MFVADVLTIWIEALEGVFGEDYPVESLRGVRISPEYPLREMDYPGLWVSYSMQGNVRNVGIGHVEYLEGTLPSGETVQREVLRWRFAGAVEITVGTLGNLERALLLDEITKVIAIGRAHKNRAGTLRDRVENNNLLGLNVVWESITVTGWGETQGTPWGTDDVVYEVTIALTTEGEVLLDPETDTIVPLSTVRILDPDLPPDPSTGWL